MDSIRMDIEKISPQLSPKVVAPNGGSRAWLVTAGAFLSQICTMGYFHSWGIFQAYYSANILQNESTSAISWIGALQMSILHFAGLLGGPLFDRYGAKAVVIPASLGTVLSVMLTSLCDEYWQLILCQGIFNGLCSGLVLAPSVGTVGQYFTTRRGLAVGIAYAGSSIGGIILPITLNRLMNQSTLGFGWSVRVVGFIMLVLLGLTGIVLKEHAPRRATRFFLFGAFKQPTYALVCIGFALNLLGMYTPIFYIVNFALNRNMSQEMAYYQVAILNAGSFVGRIGSGRFGDRLGHFNASIFVSVGAGVLVLCWSSIHSTAGIIVFSVLYGALSGSIVSLFVPCVAHVCPSTSDIGTYVGMGLATGGLGVLAGTPSSGAIINTFGWWQAGLFSGLSLLAGGSCYLVARMLLKGGVLAVV